MALRGSELAAVAVVVASVVATGGALAFGSGTTPKPGPEPASTEPPPLPTESVPTTEARPGGSGAVGEGTPVTITGIGPLRVGLTLDEVEELTGVAFAEQGEGGCTTATPDRALPGLQLVLADGEVAAISFVAGGYETLSGIGIGATEQEVRSTYADQIEQAEGSLTFVPRDPGDDQYRIVFRTNAGAVTSFAAGLLPHVVEGCP